MRNKKGHRVVSYRGPLKPYRKTSGARMPDGKRAPNLKTFPIRTTFSGYGRNVNKSTALNIQFSIELFQQIKKARQAKLPAPLPRYIKMSFAKQCKAQLVVYREREFVVAAHQIHNRKSNTTTLIGQVYF